MMYQSLSVLSVAIALASCPLYANATGTGDAKKLLRRPTTDELEGPNAKYLKIEDKDVVLYFPFEGRTKALRAASEIYNYGLIIRDVDPKDFAGLKPHLYGTQLPVLLAANSGEQLTQSTAILTHIVGQSGKLPSTLDLRVTEEEIKGGVLDIYQSLYGFLFAPDTEQKEKFKKVLEVAKSKLPVMELRYLYALAKGRKFLNGDMPICADFLIYELITLVIEAFAPYDKSSSKPFLENFPSLVKVRQGIEELRHKSGRYEVHPNGSMIEQHLAGVAHLITGSD